MTRAMRLSPAGFARMLVAVVCCGAAAGCAMTTHQIVPCPMTYSEQEKAILAIVPLGTEREATLKKLAAAGIEGSSATTQHIYYCDIWNRPNHERWHMDVALMFDPSGKLYKTQFGQADTAVLPKDAAPAKSADQTGSAQPSGRGNLPPAIRMPRVQKSGSTALGLGASGT